MMKNIWITSLISSEETVRKLMSQLKTYGLEVNGHFWEDDLEKLAWVKSRDELLNSNIVLWTILASEEDLCAPALRYGLSLLTITLQAQKGVNFPIVILQTEGNPIFSDVLPTPLKGADVLSASVPGLGAKLVAKAHAPVKAILPEYRLNTYGNAQIGQWFEVGPRNTAWLGAMFGVEGAEITFHAVGPKGSLPSESVLNYPLKGLKLNLGEKEYTAWAVQNELHTETSYFVKVEGFPKSIIFGSYSTEEEADVYVVGLK